MTPDTKTGLTDRYVADVARRLPEAQRADISREIEATIADMIDAHGGPDAERAALTELGDPAALARRYGDRPQYLIGPDLFPAYRRAMLWIVPLVGLIHVVSSIVTYAVTDDSPQLGELIGTVVGRLAIVLLVAGAVVTLVAALIEHLLPDRDREQLLGALANGPWKVDDLTKEPLTASTTRGESIVSIVAALLMAAIPFLSPSFFYIPGVPEGQTIVHPDLPVIWIVGWVALAALTASVEVLRLAKGRTTAGVLVANSIFDWGFALFVTGLVSTQAVLNPNLPDVIGPLDENPVYGIILAVVWGGTLWDLVLTYRQYKRDEASVRS